ncbi:hypothetical protein [Mucilaginibacter sp. UYCu711]|uniref:hypothetical protein n=1 Tax=Mucilaginibacter sp. UYCu711 TaxID=3156339 RepID=UPI003D232AD5
MLGIITIAAGDKRYIDMANLLALSLIKNNPDIPRAVISDAPEEKFTGFFDTYIPYEPSYGKGLSQKLFLDQYTPFKETIFIDADCLVIKPLKKLIDLCQPNSFAVLGDELLSTGEWYMDIAKMCTQFNIRSVPLFNGGLYYFKKNSVTKSIYNSAREMSTNYTQLGFKKMNTSINEEPLISVAMAMHGVGLVNDYGTGMRTPIGIDGPLKVDVLLQYCFFVKVGVEVEPAILHFSGSYTNAFHYKRECLKLKIAGHFPFISNKIISFSINMLCNTLYALLVFCKRILKAIIRNEKFDYKNYLPVFSNY